MNRPLPSLLIEGFRLALRNWPFVVWAYAVTLAFGMLAAVPVANGLAPFLDHSIAAQKIGGTIDVATLRELAGHLSDTSFTSIVFDTASWLGLVQLLVLSVLFAGTVFVYVSAEPPRLSVLLRGGIAYFWRFARVAVLAGCCSLVILGILAGARELLLARAGAVYFERKLFYYSFLSGAVVLLAGLILRLWWDLVQVYVVRNAMDGETRVRQALLPALRLLLRHFFRVLGSFLVAGGLGLGALALCLLIWKDLVPAHQVWLAFLLAQLGLFLLLASRFWQRGIEATLVMAAAPPMMAEEETAAMGDEEIPVEPEVDALQQMSEPTLSELVLKLRTDPWPGPEPILPLPSGLSPGPVAAPEAVIEPQEVLLERHLTKFPLGGIEPVEGPLTGESGEEAKTAGDPQKPFGPERKPLA